MPVHSERIGKLNKLGIIPSIDILGIIILTSLIQEAVFVDLENLTIEEKAKFRKYVIIALLVVAIILGIVGYFVGKGILNNSYDSRQQIMEVLSEGSDVEDDSILIFQEDTIPELNYTSDDILNMDSEERYNKVDLVSLSIKNIWDSLGEELKLDGCKYEVRYADSDILYKIDETSIGSIYIRCGNVIGDVKQIYKEGNFSEEDKEVLDSIDSYNLYYQDKDCEVVIIGGKKGMMKSEEGN